jgi:DNA-binding PadR family transcriptional regulator
MTPHDDLKIPSSGLSTRIALLALLALRPMHGYELRQVMEMRQMHRWADVQYGSIYRGLSQLTREGLVEEAGQHREGNRPPRTIYRINDAGQAALRDLLREAWTQPTLSGEPVDVALTFFTLLPNDEIIDLLGARLTQIDALAERVEALEAKFMGHIGRVERGEEAPKPPVAGLPRPNPRRVRAMVADQFEHRRRLLAAERGWTEHLLARFREGAYDAPEDDDQATAADEAQWSRDTHADPQTQGGTQWQQE